MHKPAILIAEDDNELASVLQILLQDDFELTFVEDGGSAIDKIHQTPFLFVVLDIHLHGKSGLEVCTSIQELPPDEQPGILILSGDMSDEMINRAYELGVSDYIGKPFNVVAFHKRLMRFARDLMQINKARIEDKNKRSVAETAMRQSAAYGSGLELLARLNHCRRVEQLLQKITSGFLSQGYHTAIECRYYDEVYQHDVDTGECNENERKVFKLLHNTGRIYNFGKRAIFNETHTSILVKNMPTVGTMSYDAAIDLFAKLVPAIDSRFLSLMHTYSIRETKSKLTNTIDVVAQMIANLGNEKQKQLQDIGNAIAISFHELDMTEVQEQFFLDLIEKKLNKDTNEDQFADVLAHLNECVANLHDDDTEEEVVEEDNAQDDDIELF